MAEFIEHPFGHDVDDMRAGLAAAMIANTNRAKDAPAVGPLDFFPWHKKPEPVPVIVSPDEVAAQVRAVLGGVGK